MAKIVLLKVFRQPRVGNMVSVEFDDGTVLKINPEIVVKHRLATGKYLEPDECRELQRENKFLAARRQLVLYLQTHRKTEAEARDYLTRKKHEPAAIDHALAAARELRLLNDDSFAREFAQTRTTMSRHGILRVRHELKAHGVDRQLIDKATKPVASTEVQLEQARAVAAKRARTFAPDLKRETRYRRLAGLLARRGFKPDVVSRVLREVLGRGDDGDFPPEE